MTKEEQTAAIRKWRAANPEKVKEISHRQYLKHKESTAIRTRKWQKDHPFQFTLMCKARFANRRYQGKIGVADVRFILARDSNKCHWCGKKNMEGRDLTLEHLQPYNDVECITISCYECNASRRSGRGGIRQTKEEIAAKIRENKRVYALENKAYLDEKKREWNVANREKIREYTKANYHLNLEKSRAYGRAKYHRRKAKREANG